MWYTQKVSKFACPSYVRFTAETLGLGGLVRSVAGIQPIKNTAETVGIGQVEYSIGESFAWLDRPLLAISGVTTVTDLFCSSLALF